MMRGRIVGRWMGTQQTIRGYRSAVDPVHCERAET